MSLARCEGSQSLFKEWLREKLHGHQAWKRDIGWHAGWEENKSVPFVTALTK